MTQKVEESERPQESTAHHAAKKRQNDEGEPVADKGPPRRAFRMLRKRPAVGAVVAGALGLAAANIIGVGELAIAMAAGSAAHKALTA